MKNFTQFALSLLFAGAVFAPVQAQEWSSTGLEVDDYRQVEIVVEELKQDALNIGLTEQRIYNKAALTLRKYGLAPANREDVPVQNRRPEYLYINVNIAGEGHSINVDFRRRVIFTTHQTGRRFRHWGATWTTGSTGTHGGKATFILDALEGYVEAFTLAYLETNQN